MRKLREREKLKEENILDSTRIRKNPYVFGSPGEFLSAVEDGYQKDLWEDQPIHLEVFSEKDAMSSVLSSVINDYRITYNMVRGFVSAPLIYRIVNEWRSLSESKSIHVLYVGDHDPSGKNIENNVRRKIQSKLRFDDEDEESFGLERIVWKRLADMDTFSDSLISTKEGDTRTPAYREKSGDRCLEVDAIDNAEIVSRPEKAILKRINKEHGRNRCNQRLKSGRSSKRQSPRFRNNSEPRFIILGKDATACPLTRVKTLTASVGGVLANNPRLTFRPDLDLTFQVLLSY